MASTEFGTNDALTVKRWSSKLARESLGQTFFRKFVGDGPNSIIQIHRDLEQSAGDQIKYDVRMLNRDAGVQGDSRLAGREKELEFYQDTISINQLRQGHEFRTMSQQRTTHDLRMEAKNALKDWWSWVFDGLMFAYLAGTAGGGSESVQSIIDDAGGDAVGFANNPLRTPDANHEYDPSASCTLAHIDVLVEKAKTLNPRIRPVRIDGGSYYVLVLHPFASYSLRTEAGDSKWEGVQRYLGPRTMKNPIFSGALGVHNGVIIYESEYIPVDTTNNRVYNLFLGAQAGAFAMGNAYKKRRRAALGGGSFFSWSEQTDDHGNSEAVGSGSVFGIQKTRFDDSNDEDFGVIRYISDDASHG